MVIDTLRLIIARSSDATREAIGAIRAQESGSPMAARRAERAARIALSDITVDWTADERVAISALLPQSQQPGETRMLDVRIRVNTSEKADVQQAADEAGLSVSNYVRQSIGLPVLD